MVLNSNAWYYCNIVIHSNAWYSLRNNMAVLLPHGDLQSMAQFDAVKLYKKLTTSESLFSSDLRCHPNPMSWSVVTNSHLNGGSTSWPVTVSPHRTRLCILQHTPWQVHLVLHLMGGASSDHHSLHLLSAGLCLVGQIVCLRNFTTRVDLEGETKILQREEEGESIWYANYICLKKGCSFNFCNSSSLHSSQ